MEPETKKKLVPGECETEEFTRFNNLLRDVLRVPTKEIQEREKKYRQERTTVKKPTRKA